MPGVGGAVHLGARRHVRFAREDDFGVVPAVPAWVYAPYVGDGFKLKATSPLYQPDTNYGGDFRRHVAIPHEQEVTGDLVTDPWPEVTQALLDMALERAAATQDVHSYTIDHYTPADPRRYLGTVAERLVIEFDGAGEGTIRFTLGLRAKKEEENDSLAEGSFTYAGVSSVPFMFPGCVFEINAAQRIDIDRGTITVENNVAPGPKRRTAGTNLGTLAYAIAQRRVISFESDQLNRLDDVNKAIRGGGSFSLEVSCYHPAGHLLQIILPYMRVEQSPEEGTPSQVAKESPRFEAVVAPSGPYAGHDIVYGVDLAAGGTTTLAPLTTTAAPTTTTTTAAP